MKRRIASALLAAAFAVGGILALAPQSEAGHGHRRPAARHFRRHHGHGSVRRYYPARYHHHNHDRDDDDGIGGLILGGAAAYGAYRVYDHFDDDDD